MALWVWEVIICSSLLTRFDYQARTSCWRAILIRHCYVKLQSLHLDFGSWCQNLSRKVRARGTQLLTNQRGVQFCLEPAIKSLPGRRLHLPTNKELSLPSTRKPFPYDTTYNKLVFVNDLWNFDLFNSVWNPWIDFRIKGIICWNCLDCCPGNGSLEEIVFKLCEGSGSFMVPLHHFIFVWL